MAVVDRTRSFSAAFPSWAMVRRELLSTLRGFRAFASLVIFVLAAAAYAIVTWPDDATSIVNAGQASRGLMQIISWILFVFCVLFVPAFSSAAIVLERERGTFDFLKMSLIRPSGIVTAKLLNAVAFFLMLLIGIVPVLSVAFFLIGIDTGELLRAMTLVVITAFSCAAAGLVSSAFFRRTGVAIGMSYVGVVALMIVPSILAFMFAGVIASLVDVRAVFSIVGPVARVASPVVTMALILGSDPGSGFALAAGCLYQALFILGCLGLTLYLVKRPQNPPKIEESRPIDDVEVLRQRMTQFPFYIIDPLRKKRPVEDGRNPMMVREMRWGLMNRGTILIRVFYVAFVVYFFAGALASLDARSYQTMVNWLMMQMVLTILVTPALMANAFTKEHELGNLDMLRMTLLRPWHLISGKLAAGTVSVIPVLVAAVLSSIPPLLLGAGDRSTLAMGYGTLFVCTAVSLSIGLLASVMVRRTSMALIVSYLFAAFVFVGFWAIMLVVVALFPYLAPYSGDDYEFLAGGLWYGLSPITAFLYSLPNGPHELPLYHWNFWAAGMTCWAGVAALLVFSSVKFFEKFRMRDV